MLPGLPERLGSAKPVQGRGFRGFQGLPERLGSAKLLQGRGFRGMQGLPERVASVHATVAGRPRKPRKPFPCKGFGTS